MVRAEAEQMNNGSNGTSSYSSSADPAVSLDGVHRIYHLAGEDIHAVNDVTLDVWPRN